MIQPQSAANQFLMGAGIASAKFPSIGTTVGGVVISEPEVRQDIDFDSRAPKFWDDGRPIDVFVVGVQTDLRDPEKPDDDGQRRFYAKSAMARAIAAAVRKAGQSGVEVGGTLTVTYTGDGIPSRKGISGPKEYSATYEGPATTFLNGEHNGQQQQQPGYPAPPQQAYPAPPQQAYPAPPQQAYGIGGGGGSGGGAVGQAQFGQRSGPAPTWATPQQQPAQQQQQQPPAAQAPPQPPAQLSPPNNIDPAMWATLTPEAQQALANLASK